MALRRILIIADIEGSSGCWNYAASSFLTPEWALACEAMTQDVQAVVEALLRSGAEEIVVKDFHRTGYNLLPERIDPRARVDGGYALGPIPGMGDPGRAEAVMFLGLHAASGTRGFLPHTMTSRLAEVRVDGRPLPEVALFASLLAPYGVRPVFFSGCPVACEQARGEIPGIGTFAIDKTGGPDNLNHRAWRKGLARAAVSALSNDDTEPLAGRGPFNVQVAFRDGETKARKIARRWQLERRGDAVHFRVRDLPALFEMLSRICYLVPALLPIMPLALPLYKLKGRAGLAWVRRYLKKMRGRDQVAPSSELGNGF
jgi:D-aminopeptidase